MAMFQYSKDFMLTDVETGEVKKLSDFGGQRYNPSDVNMEYNLLPELEHITDENDNLDGERYVRSRYGTRIIEVPVFLTENYYGMGGELFELRKWLGKKRQQVFSWVLDDENKEIDVIYKDDLDINIYYGKEFNAVTTLKFIAHNPFWRMKHEQPLIKKNLQAGNIFNINNKGNVECYPLLKITPNGTQSKIIFRMNKLTMTLTSIDKPFYIDTEAERCYEIVDGNKTPTIIKYSSDKFRNFPYLIEGDKNEFEVISGSFDLDLEYRTRII